MEADSRVSAPKFTVSKKYSDCCGRFIGYAVSDGVGIEEMVRNPALARVIETHEAVCAALEALIARDSGNPQPCGHDYYCVCASDLARAALAKARGES